jgi:hypothetical protein
MISASPVQEGMHSTRQRIEEQARKERKKERKKERQNENAIKKN